MNDSIEHIASALKSARKKKGISQRTLSSKTGVPQSHISKIEKGLVDLRISGLIEISRSLDLELMLIPRQMLPAIKALLAGTKINKNDQIPAYQLTQEEGDDE